MQMAPFRSSSCQKMNFEICGWFAKHNFSKYSKRSPRKSSYCFPNRLIELLFFLFISLMLVGSSTAEQPECYSCGDKLEIRGRMVNGEEVRPVVKKLF